jgi:hypothetical protein
MTIVNIPTANPAIARPEKSLEDTPLYLNGTELTSEQYHNINGTCLDGRTKDEYDNRKDHVQFPTESIGDRTVDE